MSADLIGLLALFAFIATLIVITIFDCESDADYYARDSRRRLRALKRDHDRQNREWRRHLNKMRHPW